MKTFYKKSRHVRSVQPRFAELPIRLDQAGQVRATRHARQSQILGQNPLPRITRTGNGDGQRIDRSPAVSFNVRNLRRTSGRLDDPDQQTTPGHVGWPVSFAVNEPLKATADVVVSGGAADPCSRYQIGFLQTVHSNWLNAYYWGRSRGHGSAIMRITSPTPIRDGDPSSMWYSSHVSPTACNNTVQAEISDYPTIFNLEKTVTNSVTSQTNYLTGLDRGIHFVTTLVATDGSTVRPLRHFYWNYWMAIRFRPNYSNVNADWPFTWRTNRASLGRIRRGRDGAVPIFTTASNTYNRSLTPLIYERS